MVVPSVLIQSRVQGFEEKSLVVMGFETNDFDFFKVQSQKFNISLFTFHVHLQTFSMLGFKHKVAQNSLQHLYLYGSL